MAITTDGAEKFGILNPTITGAFLATGYTLESFSRNFATNRTDLNDGNGEPLDAVTVPQREEMSATVQLGTGLLIPEVGDPVTLDSGSSYYILTDVSSNETQEDFVRLDFTAFKPTNGVRPIKFKKISGGQNFDLDSIEESSTLGVMNQTSQFGSSVASTDLLYINAFVPNETSLTTYQINYTPASGSIDLANSTFSTGVTVVTASTNDTQITFRMTSTATQAEIGLKFA